MARGNGDKTTPPDGISVSKLFDQKATPRDQLVDELQENLTKEKDARREDQFVFVVVVVLLLDVVFFSVMPTLSGPIALVILELLILIPLAKRMGMEEIAQLLDRVLSRVARHKGDEDG